KNVALIETRVPGQEHLLALVANSARRDFIRVPHDDTECQRVRVSYEQFLAQREQRLRELIEDRTADEDLQGRVLDALTLLIMRGRQ
ncbi:MAG TPA: hypothetical protein PKL84_15035, partial [Candidatus Hydrogenedentes bacterium]|nr:hypothetical protein [Candidatus Hydrogenedentota bacterium]